VTKKPTFTNGGELTMRAGSYGYYKPSVDVYGVAGSKGKAAWRMNAAYEDSRSFRQQVSANRVYINPSFQVMLGKKTDVLIEADYLKDNRTADFGTGTINYELIAIPRDRFIGVNWSYYKTEQKSSTVTFTHRFNRNWQIKNVSSVQTFNNELFSNVRPNSNGQFVQANGNWMRGLQKIVTDDQYMISQLDLTGKFYTGCVRHNLLIGGDVDDYQTGVTAYNVLKKYDSVNVFEPGKYKERNDIPDLTRNTRTRTPIRRAGFYVQDLMDLCGKLKLLAGVRLSYLETGSKVLTYSNNSLAESKQYDFAPTPRLGLVYQPGKKMSVFGSYASSFSPNTGVDVNGKSLAPSYFKQYEAGIKTNIFKDLLSANVTAYQIINDNLAQTSLANGNTNTNIKELAGEVTSKGVEADVMSKNFYGFSVIAGYSYNETRYTRSNTYIVGSMLRYNPNHTANASVYYVFQNGPLKGLGTGISCLYFGERMAGRSTRVTVADDPYKLITLPAYTLLDVNLSYHVRNLTLRLKISNMTNALSYNVHDDNSVNPIAPRQYLATIGYKF
jgi:iron complex outermembrane receptor protein